jgi:hypothetical protein
MSEDHAAASGSVREAGSGNPGQLVAGSAEVRYYAEQVGSLAVLDPAPSRAGAARRLSGYPVAR